MDGPLGKPGDWLLEQGKGYIWAFVLAVVVIVPLALLGVVPRDFLILPAALAFPAATVGLLLVLHRGHRRKDHP